METLVRIMCNENTREDKQTLNMPYLQHNEGLFGEARIPAPKPLADLL